MRKTSREFADEFRIRYIELAKRILALHLLEQPMTSYELSLAIHQGSKEAFPLRQVFAVLVVLQEMGAVEVIERDGKRYYHTTPEGKECLRLCLEEFYPLREGVSRVLDSQATHA